MTRTTPLALWLSVPVLAAAPLAWNARQDDPEDFARTGVVGGWRLDTFGNVFVRVDHEATRGPGGGEETQTSTWFRTPPDRNAQVRLEELLMEIVLEQRALEEPSSVTIYGKVERRLDGSSPEQAIPLVAIDG